MILPFTIFLSFLLISPSWGTLSTVEFESFLSDACFKQNEKGVPYVNGQENPLASTLENFIALVEKFEVANPRTTFKDELFYFIRNYTYTNMEYNSLGDIARWTPMQYKADEIDKLWEQDDNRRNSQPQVEDPFTDAEKCSLFFMISHSIVRKSRKFNAQRADIFIQNGTISNRTTNEQRDEIFIQNGTTDSRKAKWGSDTFYNDEDLYPLEHGVVAIQGTEEAVSLMRVLLGLYIGLDEGRRREISTFNIDPKYLPTQGTVVDPLYSLTMAEVIAMATWRPEAGKREFFAREGNWISVAIGTDIETKDVCPMVYRLRDATESAYSYSEIRGAADGLILGKISREIERKKSDVKLSQVLRQYYSKGGFVEKTPDMGDIRASFCNREFLLNNWEAMMKEQVNLFILMGSQSYAKVGESLEFSWNKYLEEKNLGVLRNNNPVIKDYCGNSVTTDNPENLPLETPLDVIVILDAQTNEENFKREQLIIGSLAKRLQLSHTGSRMTIFTDQKDLPPSVSVPGTIYLKTVVDDTYSPACAACSVTQLERANTASLPEDEVFIAINQYLTAKVQNQTRFDGVNGKVIILFNFDEDVSPRPTAQEVKRDKALRDLYIEHSDVSIIALGKNIEALKHYANKGVTHILNAFDLAEEEIGKQLYHKVIATPAKLQYSDCVNARAEKSAIFEDFVTPNSVQRWMMPAKYFYKSFSLKFSFESFYGTSKVCHSRTWSPELRKESCLDVIPGKPVEIKHSNPCKGFDSYSCAPFYFSILGVNITDGTDRDYCDDKMTANGDGNQCKTLDQIKFKVSHEGIRCSGAMGLMTSSLSLFLMLFFSHLFFKLS